MNPLPQSRLSRRHWLGLSVGAVVLSGCTPSDESTSGGPSDSGETSRRRDVPLRIVLVADEAAAEAIRKTWSGVAEQSLDFVTLTSSEAGNPSGSDPSVPALADAARNADVLMYPALLQGQLVQAEAIATFSEAALAEDRLHAETLYPALRLGPMQYGKQPISVPLGTVIPALLVATARWDQPEAISWDQFSEHVATLPKGRAAEPLEEGWAAKMFLYRANSYCDDAWLFDRDDFQPLLTREPYRRALTQMVEAAKTYPDRRMAPNEINEAIRAGKLDLAIGWPAPQAGDQPVGDVRLQPLPVADQWYSETQASWIENDPTRTALFLSGDGLVASISARCRQTAAANEFVRWLSRNETAADLGERLVGLNAVRRATGDSPRDDRRSTDPVAMQYNAYLREQLSATRIRTMLRIPAATRYLQHLDDGVLQAIEGELTVEESLQHVTNAWETITIEQGREEQLRHWRKSTGLRY